MKTRKYQRGGRKTRGGQRKLKRRNRGGKKTTRRKGRQRASVQLGGGLVSTDDGRRKPSELAKKVHTLYNNLNNQSITMNRFLETVDDWDFNYYLEEIKREVEPAAEMGEHDLDELDPRFLQELIQIGSGIQDRLEHIQKLITERHPERRDGLARLSREQRADVVMQQLRPEAKAYVQQGEHRGGDRSKRSIRRCLKHGGRRSSRTGKRGGIFGKPSGHYRTKIAKKLRIDHGLLGVSDTQKAHLHDDNPSVMGSAVASVHSLFTAEDDEREARRPPPSGVERGYDDYI